MPLLARTGLALALGTAGGWLAYRLTLPLPWMIGAMLATTLASVAGAPVQISLRFRALMVAVLGVMLGSGFTPAILDQLGDWSVSLAALAIYSAVAGAAGMVFFHRIAGYDPVTAYFSGMPGGLSEMILAGEAMGGDGRVISLTHASRILLVVLALPFAFQFLFGYDPAAKPASGGTLFALQTADWAILGLCGVLGFAGAKLLRLPAAAVVGPMLLSALVHLAGWSEATPPGMLVAAAQVVVGGAIGCRFAGAGIALIRRAVAAAAGGTVVLVVVMLLFAAALHTATGLPLEALVLAYAPGGLAEMSLIAIALASDAAFVATHHIVRIFLIVVLAPLAFRLLRRRRRIAGRP